MSHGTPLCTSGQLATVASRIITALPKAIEVLVEQEHISIKQTIGYTEQGERLSLALTEMFKMLYNGSAKLIPRLVFSSTGKMTLSDGRPVLTMLEPSTSWTIAKFVTALLDVPSCSDKDEALKLLQQRAHVLSCDEAQALFRIFHQEKPHDRLFFFRYDGTEAGMVDAWSLRPGDPHMVRVTDWFEELGPEHRIIVRNFDPRVGQIRPPV